MAADAESPNVELFVGANRYYAILIDLMSTKIYG
jgi:hypothetical protein